MTILFYYCHKVLFFICIFIITFFTTCTDNSNHLAYHDQLEQGFISPPRSARPNVMWWWLNSNISKEGITRDLEEMNKNGIGGALIFDAAPVDRWRPKNVESAPIGPPFMSEEWRKLFRHAIKEASRLDIELGVSMTSGFNAGGPWVTPEYGQQEIVWSETILKGPGEYELNLSLPSGPILGNDGKLLNYNEMKVNNDLEFDSTGKPIHYRDVAVLAIPIQDTDHAFQPNYSKLRTPPGRLKNWALKSVHSFNYPEDRGFVFDAVYDNIKDLPDESAVMKESILDITDRLDEKGILYWKVPQGEWLILRFGHTYTGIHLQATNPQNKGLGMNHLSSEAAQKHFKEIGLKMVADVEATGGNSFKYFYLDSWEVRIANWTPGFRQEFQIRRGYDMTPYLPVLAGRIVDNREISNRFLHDYRQTIGDCIADNYYGKFQDQSRQHGLQFRAEMATTPIPVDMLKCLGRCDVPFGEFWTETDLEKGRVEPWERMFGKQAASAAHIYGTRFAAAEALTVIQKHWEHSPYQLKRTTDQAFCSGLNNLMVHTFTHSPPGIKPPGYEYFAGTHFNPQITWWDQAHVFTNYISRCQYMLQQGHFVADVCFYQGDQIPNFVPMKKIHPGLGPGYDYDVVNTEVILTRMSVKNGRIILPDGMSYRMLILPDSEMINPDVLHRIEELIESGATVIGSKPIKAYGLTNYPECDSIIKTTADRLWGDCNGTTIKERHVGKGRIIYGKTPREVLLGDGILADFESYGLENNIELDYIHRSITNDSETTDIYFVVNFKKRWINLDCSFRINNKMPEIWNPKTGKIYDLPIYTNINGRIICPLSLPPLGSVFVVFRKDQRDTHISKIVRNSVPIFPAKEPLYDKIPALNITSLDHQVILLDAWRAGKYQLTANTSRKYEIDVSDEIRPIEIGGSWILKFPPDWGTPDSVRLESLISWTEHPNQGVKYFSGTAVYHKTFEMNDNVLKKDTKYILDLGKVSNIAEIVLNSQALPIQWKPPYRTDVTPWLHAERNELQIKITNLWPNRLIGDQFLPVGQRYAFTNIAKFTKASPLLESGLLGPVKIYIVPQIRVEL